MEKITLNEKQKEAIEYMRNGTNVLITGMAGTGKSFLVKIFKGMVDTRFVGITSMTGTSSILIGGSTLHSYLGIGLGTASSESLVQKIRKKAYLLRRWTNVQTLIIDEVSMLTPTLFDKLEYLARRIRRNKVPFGGIHLVLFGDFLQLPCIDSETFCFDAQTWDETIGKVVYLQKIYRQDDREYMEALSEIRLGELSKKTISLLKSRENVELKNELGIKPTKLFSLNVSVDEINQQELDRLAEMNENLEFYQYELQTDFKGKLNQQFLVEKMRKNCRAPEVLELAVGTQVMLIWNLDFELGLVNGSRGVVIDFEEDRPIVQFMNGVKRLIDFITWDIEEDGKAIMSFTQIPLKLAWAYTIHRVQGATLDCVDVDLGEVFEYGQAYVALSRARNLEGLRISNLNISRIKAHPLALKFYKNLGE